MTTKTEMRLNLQVNDIFVLGPVTTLKGDYTEPQLASSTEWLIRNKMNLLRDRHKRTPEWLIIY